MSKQFSLLSQTILGITISIFPLTLKANSASAATLKAIGSVYGLAVRNNSSSQGWCKPSISGLTMSVRCDQSFNAGAHLGVSTAGGFGWRDIFQEFQFTGNPGRRYRISFNLSGSVSASAKGAGAAGANAASGLAPRSGGSSTFINLWGLIASTSSDWKSHYSSSFFDFNGGSTWRFLVGAKTYGDVQAYGLGSAKASASTSFTSIASIWDIGSSRGRSAAFSTMSETDFGSLLEEDYDSLVEEDYDSLIEEDYDSISEENFDGISENLTTKSVPEPATLIGSGLGLVGTLLLKKRRSRSSES